MGPLETIQSGLNNWIRDARVHLAGRGVMTGTTILATAISNLTGWFIVPAVVAVGGVGLHMFHRLREQWEYQDTMANKYRSEIAERLGIAPDAVTREHVKLAAYGSEADGIDGNPILAQALERQRGKSWLVFGTAMIAAVVTFALLTSGAGFAAGAMLEALPILQNVPIIPNIIGLFGGAVVAGLSSIFIQDGLEFLLGAKTGISAPSAHDRILAIEARQARGKSITPEKVFQVKLAANPELEERVVSMTGKKFHSLKADMQSRVLAQLDPKGEMSMIADELNKKAIDAKELAFVLTGQQTVHPTKEREKEPTQEAQHHKKSFAEHLGFKHKEHKSHVDRVEESRVVPIESARS